jgi:hypothetical protein
MVLAILVLSLFAYSKLSNHCVKLQKMNQETSASFWWQRASQIVLVSLNDDCSVQDRQRGPDYLVNRILNMSEKISCMSVNKTATQKIWRQHFLLPGGASSKVGETVEQIWPQVVGIAALLEFYKNNRFLIHIFFHTSDLKYHRKNEFTKKTSSKNENGFDA